MEINIAINPRMDRRTLDYNLDMIRDSGMKLVLNGNIHSDDLKHGFLDFRGDIDLVDIDVNESTFNKNLVGGTDNLGQVTPNFRGKFRVTSVAFQKDRGTPRSIEDYSIMTSSIGMVHYYLVPYTDSRVVSPFGTFRIFDSTPNAVNFHFNQQWSEISMYNMTKVVQQHTGGK